MFYCEPCANDAEWPTYIWIPMSHGRCELCARVAPCFDVPSSQLPGLPANFWLARNAELNAGKHIIEEHP